MALPLRRPIEEHLNDVDIKDGVLVLVNVDLSKIPGKTIKINVSFPERFLKQIDDYTYRQGVDLSFFLVDAAICYMAEHPVYFIKRCFVTCLDNPEL